ncbi:MAG: hypothetical protein EU550_00465 [Promethearchaeota archaeon]|nr:MAG: hypothetical protein EU550_00465 [Candidatus Lokiarchaeota archaeon]
MWQVSNIKRFRILSYLAIIIFIVIINSLFPFVIGIKTIDSTIGNPPIIDGSITSTDNEWDDAETYSIILNKTPTDLGLPIEVGVMQNQNNLYIYVEFEIEVQYRSEEEFFGLLISKNSSYERNCFIDAKILQFQNTSTSTYQFLDYYINESLFYPDSESQGTAAADVESLISIYEFRIPINNVDANNSLEDSFLELGSTYAFNLTYGSVPNYPEGILKSTTVLINLEQKPVEPLTINYKLILQVCSYVIFGTLGAIFGYYIYKIVNLRRKIERIRA